MTYHALIFTNNQYPFKAAGAYAVATQLREHGYKTKIIENFVYLHNTHPEKFLEYIFKSIGKKTLFIGVSSTFLWDTDDAYKILAKIKEKYPHIKIINGGPREGRRGPIHKFSIRDSMIDYHILGYSEIAILKIIEEIKKGNKLEKLYQYDPLGNQFDFTCIPPIFSKEEDIVFPNEVLPIQIARGCPFRCKFCNFPLTGISKSEMKYTRTRESIRNELLYNYENFKTSNYAIIDDTFNTTTAKVKLIKDIVDELGIPFNFIAYLRIDLIHRFPEQIHLLKEMGLKGAFFGIESLHDPSAKAIGKGLGSEKTIAMLYRLKEEWGKYIQLHCNFILGLPYESEKTFKNWMIKILQPGFPMDSMNISALEITKNPEPGMQSPFSENAEKYGYTILDDYGGWESIYPLKSLKRCENLLYYQIKPLIQKKYKRTMYGRTRFWNKYTAQNFGYTWKELVDNFPKKNKLIEAEKHFKESYAERLFNS